MLVIATFFALLTFIFFKSSVKIFFKKNKLLLIIAFVSLILSYAYDGFSINRLNNHIFAFSKFINLILISFAIFSSTSPTELSNALESLLKPFEFLGLNAKEIAVTSVLSLRFFPILKKEWKKISIAQKMRCGNNQNFNPVKIFIKYINISIIFFKLCFKKSEIFAQAMESRCWSLDNRK